MNKLSFSIVLLATLVLTMSVVSAYTGTNGLLFGMNFTRAYNDTLGLNNGTGVGSPTIISNAACPIAARYPCYNSTGFGQEITVANTALLRSGTYNLSAFTITWAIREKDASNSRNDRIFYTNNSVNGDHMLQVISGSSGGKVYSQWQPASTNTNLFTNGTLIADTTYVRMITYDGTTLRFYQNGTLQNSTTYNGGIVNLTGVIRIFGATNIANANSVNGTADEFYMYNRAFSDTEAAQYNTDLNAGYGPGEGNTTVTPTTGDIYVSMTDGNDSQSGNSTNPLRTIDALRSLNIAGRTVRFDGGVSRGVPDVWRMPDDYFLNHTVLDGGNSTNYTTITCYNCNETMRPILTGSHNTTTSDWTQVSGSLWVYSPGKRVSNLIFGDIRTESITAGYRLYFKNSSTLGRLGYTQLNSTTWWWQNFTTTGSGDYKIYINSTGNPVTYYSGVEVVQSKVSSSGYTQAMGTCIQSWSGGYYNFTGLHLRACDYGMESDRDNVQVINNTVSWIGGGFSTGGGSTGATRWGNGIESWLDADNWVVSYNKAYEVYDAALSPQGTSGTGVGITPTNQAWTYNKVWNSAYCYEHYFSPDSVQSYNISFTHNTCYNIGEGWYRTQRGQYGVVAGGQTDQTATPKMIRLGRAMNVRALNISDNLFYNASTHMIGLQSISDVPGWNTSANYSIENNFYYKETDPQYSSVTAWFNLPGLTTYSSLSSWVSATIHDDTSITETAYPFSSGPPYLIPLYESGICTAGYNGGYVGAVSCAAPAYTTKTILPNAPDQFVYPADSSVTVQNGGCEEAYDGNWDTGVESVYCGNITLVWTNPGSLISGDSQIIVKEYVKRYPSLDWEYVTRNISLPVACEQSPITIREEYYYRDGSSVDTQYMRFYCDNGGGETELENLGPEWGGPVYNNYNPQFHWIFETGINFSRTDYISFDEVTPVSGSSGLYGESINISTTTHLMGGSYTMKQYVYNSSGSLIDQQNTTSSTLNRAYTFPYTGTFYYNASVENDTHISYSDNRSYSNYIDLSITNPSSDYQTLLNYYNFSWTTTSDLSSLRYSVLLYNSTGGFNKTLASGLTNKYYYSDFVGDGVPEGNVTFRIIVNDTASGTYRDDNISFTVLLITGINITAKRYSNNETIDSFTATLLYNGTTTTYTTTTGQVLANITRGVTYNITISASSFRSNSTLFGTNGTSAQLNFTLRGQQTLNITFYDEYTGNRLSSTVTVDFISDLLSRNYSAPNGNLTIFDVEPETYTLRYTASGYSLRFYTLTVSDTSTDTVNNLNLYLVNSTRASNITIYIIDEITNPVEGATVKALKYNLATNSYILQESAITDASGKVSMSLTKGDEYYKFMVEVNGVLVRTTEPAYITTDSFNIQISISPQIGTEYFNYKSLSYTLVFNSLSDNFRLDYSDASGIGSNYCLYVYKGSNQSQTLYDSSCSTSASGTLLITIEPVNGTTYYAKAYYTESGTSKLLTALSYTYPLPDVLQAYGLFLQLLVTLATLATVFLSPVLALILVPFSFILGHVVGLNAFSIGTLATIQIMGLIMAAVYSSRKG